MAQIPNIEYETTIFTLKLDIIGPNKPTLLHARTTNNNMSYKCLTVYRGVQLSDALIEQYRGLCNAKFPAFTSTSRSRAKAEQFRNMTEHHRNLYRKKVEKNREEFRLIWLDTNVNDSVDSVQIQMMLLKLNPAALFYSDFNQCIDFMKSIKDEQILFIVSETLASVVLPQIHHFHLIGAIWLFCTNPEQYSFFKNKYKKIIEVPSDQDSLLKSLSQTISRWKKQRMTFNLFNHGQETLKDVSKDSPLFLWYQMLLYVLKQMPQDEQSKEDMLNKCRDYYSYDQAEMDKIEEFRRDYNQAEAIKWFTKDCFLYRLLNRALRTQNIELLYSFRFFIIDLCLNIERENKELRIGDDLTLYRGQTISMEELEKLRDNVGKIMSINAFWSASRDPQVAKMFSGQDNLMDDWCSVFFTITVDSSVKTVICSDVSSNSQFPEEQEILFSLNSLFKIISVELDLGAHLWKVQLQATDEGCENAEGYRKSVQQGTDVYSPTVYFGRLLLHDGDKIDEAEKYFKMLLETLPSDHPHIGPVNSWVGVVYHKRKKLDLAMKYYMEAYRICRERLPSHHPQIARCFYNFAFIAEDKLEFDAAIDNYKKSLSIDEKNYKGDHGQKAQTIKKIGMVYRKKRDFNTALKYSFRALEMFQRILPEQHAHIAMCFRNIGQIYLDEQKFDEALDYFHRKLKMDEQCLPSDHHYLCGDFELIAETYKMKGDIEKFLEFGRKKLIDQKNMLAQNHPRIARTLMTMANVLIDTNLDKALEYYEEALFVLDQSQLANEKTIAVYLESLTSLYSKKHISDDALPGFLKVFDLSRQKLPACDDYIADICRKIGLYYREMRNSPKTRYYFNESLSIYRVIYGPQHKKVKTVQGDIAALPKEKRT